MVLIPALGVALPVSFLFPDEFFYTQPMLIRIRCPGSYGHFTPVCMWYQAMVLMHGSKDLILVTDFRSRLWGWITGEYALFT